MILPDNHDIPDDLYDEHHGEFTYEMEGEVHPRCKICGAKAKGTGDAFGGVTRCTETGTMLFDW